MKSLVWGVLTLVISMASWLGGSTKAYGAPAALDPNIQIRLVLRTTNGTGEASVRLAKDPRNNQLYYLKGNGDIFALNLQPGGASTSTKVYSAADHGLNSNVEGMAIGPDGTIYVVGNNTTNSTTTFARIVKGVPNGNGGRSWSLLARTQPYPRTQTGVFDHLFNGIVASPDGQYVYVNSGARTDHGEEQSNNGLYPGLRDIPLTTKIFRLPTSGSNLTLTNDLNILRQSGYIFCEGVRNAFDLAFGPGGDLFGTDNGPDRDMSESLYWLRPGLHFGFPWRMGGADNPQQFPGYDPSTDKLLDSRYYAVGQGYYHNDPSFPPPPTNFTDAILNVGPHADSFRDPADGTVKDASSLGLAVSTFTPHRSPLGLVFDTGGAMNATYQHHGFVLSWTPGDPNGNTVAGPFKDASQDMLDLNLVKLGNTNYQANVNRVVGGFSNPIDAEIIGNRIYVIEYGGNQGIWEITFPAALTNVTLSGSSIEANGSFGFDIHATPGLVYEIDTSNDLISWAPVTNVIPMANPFRFVEPGPIGESSKFYRVVQH